MKVIRRVEPSIYYQAEAFHIAALTLYQAEAMEYRGAPFIVNASFALELYLKAFDGETVFKESSEYCEFVTQYKQVVSKGNTQGHGLSSLFNRLAQEYKDKIVSQLVGLTFQWTPEMFFEKYNNHFVSWRYGFEGNRSSYVASDVLDMLSVLQNVGKEYL
ncbi:hypothetical protein V9K20_003564 [Vibrio cholerae]|uniref:Uncharacterized protein n=1 Tax=Vibrio cholerae TaxID=666 RepID=A0A544H1N1_VIBCL|nr:hypothetical protein [Vibrio cholerae]EGQ9189780.1 hypothetical protein [Vibrio cholerae]EKF9603797.1 hypothetical protein [Vibrio cholerae]EKF9799912.1 hypothetical protein [Vibrio cholerae]ELH5152297.1 hypothetical protein [Vibrio cholerae]MDV2315533.1 hypothetical protein [Vibrio cholerae]